MTSIIESIDALTNDFFSAYTKKIFGFCELMTKTAAGANQPMPVTIADRVQASIDDRYQVVSWIRQTTPVQFDTNEDWSFGKTEARYATMPIRLVIAHKVELGENLIYEFINSLPSKLSIPDYKFVFISASLSVDPDHESIYNTELGQIVYEKHRFAWNIYVITLTAQWIICT